MKCPFYSVAMVFLMAAAGLAQSTTFYLPQIADGMETGSATHWHTTIFISNLSTATATGTIAMTQSNGSTMSALFTDEAGAAAARSGQISFSLTPGQTHKYTSTAAQPLQVGFATVNSSAPVSVNAVFSHYGNGGAEFLMAEAGVPPSMPLPKQAVFVDTQFGFNPGIAIANPNGSTETITLQVVNAEGQVVASTTRILGARQHFSAFLPELFPGLTSMAGSLQIFAADPLVSMALRFDSKLNVFTTLFPFPVP